MEVQGLIGQELTTGAAEQKEKSEKKRKRENKKEL